MDIIELKSCIETAFSNYLNSEELSFIQLTGKSEHAIRDAVAFEMYKRNLNVTREYKRVDLVVFDDEYKPTDLIEFKLCYTWDIQKDANFNGYRSVVYGEMGINKDFNKLNEMKIKDADQFAVLCVIHPTRDQIFSKDEIDHIIAYHDINRFIEVNRLTEFKVEYEKVIEDSFSGFQIEKFKIKLGMVFNCNVSLHFWIIKRMEFDLREVRRSPKTEEDFR
ncbi:hypothetical protein [Paenibacillus glacialis]|uniref:Restriction endonuclease n=1 Tax=Paenibacillus glacialis TaxID=494026 RepID=A0A168NPF9_9BACL|nr:hypothetical protein [Paenibacillus glacialis]OAB45999.1 hypothetical protein PGLA_00960 [Paenibacillus glacialis]